jgi:DNA repair exonuclease SbcCD ATPase subunit
MELRLLNFRCYRDKTFVFPKGVLLIDGPSGKGKTTILTAIKYALFGKVTQISTYGEKKTSVTLLYNGIKVVRTNVPSRLLVSYGDKMVEDDAAQEYIYQLFGRQFELTSYMVQKGAIQFFTLSGADKLKLLEQLSLLGEDHIQQMKDSIQRDMKEKKRQTERLESQIELLESQLGSKPTLIKKKGFLTLLDIQRMIDFISHIKKSWEEQRTHCTILLQTYADQLKKQRSEKMARDSILHSLRHDRSELDRLTEEKNVNEVSESELMCLQQQLLEYDQYIVYQQKQKEWQEKTKVYEDLIQQETDRIALQMNELKEKIVPMTDSVENVRTQIKHVEQINIQWKHIRDLSQSLQKEELVKSQMDDLHVEDCTLYQLKIEYHNHYLFYQSVENELYEIKKRYQEQILSYQNEIQELQSRLQPEPTLHDEKEQIQICTEQLVTWKRLRMVQMELSNEKMVDIQSRFEATTRQKDKMEKMLHSMEIRKRVQSCPQCNTSLIIHTNQIVSASHQPISESDKKTEEKYKTELPKWKKQYENQYRLLLASDELKKEEESLIVKVKDTSEEELQFRLKTLTSYLESIYEIQHHNRVIQKQLDEKQDPIVKYHELELKWKEMEHTLTTLPKGEYCDSIDIVKEKVLHMKYKKEQEKVFFQQWVDAQ